MGRDELDVPHLARSRRILASVVLLLGTFAVLALPAVAGEDTASVAVFGTLRSPNPDVSVEGVRIVAERDGEVVGEAEVGAEGAWEIPLEEPGTYTVSIDQESLPEGITVRDPDQFASKEVEVDGRNAVLFPLIEGEGGGAPVSGVALRRMLNLTVEGIKFGAIIAITSVGLSLIFGVTGLVNFAHGEMVTIGAVVALYFNSPGGIHVHLILAGLLAIVIGAGTGWGLESGVFGPLRRRKVGNVALLVISIGLSILLRYGILVVYGGQSRPYRDYTIPAGFKIGPITSNTRDLVVTGLALVVLVLIGLLLTRTKLGTAMRAVADNRDLAESSGIDVQRVILATWVAGGALAALGGVFQGMLQAVQWNMGFALLLLMFAGVILGGLGTAFGAMAGGLLVGIITQVSTYWFSVDLKLVFAFGVLIVVLLFRPQGLLGRRERIG